MLFVLVSRHRSFRECDTTELDRAVFGCVKIQTRCETCHFKCAGFAFNRLY